ncbi:HNH endonuclease family protein [Streptomyces sp. NPDC058294]|uniref:HNH endonuclease family protein n=1 Tax=Streptomyces sp. NPDC058294 TaxID=3346430 RepID=UPI0036E83AD2
MPFARTAAATVVFTCLLFPAGTHATAAAAPGDKVTAPVQDLLARLPVWAEDRTGYERTAFRHWIDADGDGCNTRAEVLKAEAVIAPAQDADCRLSGGEWSSPYDNRYLEGPGGVDIDHLVPLAEAWDSGASAWTAKEREAYANDLGDDRPLIAVSAASNRAKGDQDPATWLPPAAGYHCTYVTDWVADKLRWGLSVDSTEQAALTDVLSRCPNVSVTVARAR